MVAGGPRAPITNCALPPQEVLSAHPLTQTAVILLMAQSLTFTFLFFPFLYTFPLDLLLVSATYPLFTCKVIWGKKNLLMERPKINVPKTKVCSSQTKKIQVKKKGQKSIYTFLRSKVSVWK